MLIGLETFSYHAWFGQGAMDAFAFIERSAELGLGGVQLNVNGGNFGHVGGDDPGRLREIRQTIEALGLFVEIDSRGMDPDHLTAMLHLCSAVGADTLRTYASCGGDLEQELAEAPGLLRQVVPVCADLGVRIGVENHEYETSGQILDLVRQVDSEWVGTHVDTGNSMMVWEDPVDAVRALAPLAVSSHFKDHVVVKSAGDQPVIAGVTLGTGSIDCAECFRTLSEDSPLERLIIEVCYGYSAPFRCSLTTGAGAARGTGAFCVLEGPFHPSWVLLPRAGGDRPSIEQILAWQDRSVEESVAFVKGLNASAGGPRPRS